MARMHSRKKGKSGSKKPPKTKKPLWERYNKKEILLLIEKLAKTNNSPSKIGLILRDTYGIPDVISITGKNITSTLKELNIVPKLPEDLASLIQKEIKILKHLETNKKDNPSLRNLALTESKIKRLAKHYREIKRLPPEWRFNREKAKLFLE